MSCYIWYSEEGTGRGCNQRKEGERDPIPNVTNEGIMGSEGGTIPERVTLVRELTNVHTKQRPSFLVRGRLAQTVKEEKDISDESNSLT